MFGGFHSPAPSTARAPLTAPDSSFLTFVNPGQTHHWCVGIQISKVAALGDRTAIKSVSDHIFRVVNSARGEIGCLLSPD